MVTFDHKVSFLTFFCRLCSVLSEKLYEKRLHQGQFPPQHSKFYQQTGHLLGLLWLEAACSNLCVNRRLFSKQAFSETKQHAPKTLFVFSRQGNNCFTCSVKIMYFKWWIDQVQSWGINKLWCLMTDEGSGESVPHFKQTMKPDALYLFCPTSTLDRLDQTCEIIMMRRPNQHFSLHNHVILNAFSNTR